MAKTWLVTGSGRGLGRHIAEAVLAAGDNLLATARDTAQLAHLQQRHGARIRVARLDVTDAAAAQAAVRQALDAFGALDVLVNNAGYGHIAPFEQTAADDFRAQMDANFYGVVHLVRAALPAMRQQRSGHIINISSVGGRVGTPGLAAYQSAKWAVGGFTEVMAMEAAPFGVKFVSVEPGGMNTDWAGVAGGRVPELLPDYQASVGYVLGLLKQHSGKAAGDPARVAQVILALAAHPQPPSHLLLGSDALHYFGQADARRQRDAADWEQVSRSTDAGASAPIPAFPAAAGA
jgi:NAD(P)-dependent dehydrogenase (short-subunit alcohol dehydrogenase family)